MREIKFRAWHKHHKCWVNRDMLGQLADRYLFINPETKTANFYLHDHSMTGYDSIAIVQFTGRHDKNGKEIYEGDIITAHHPDDDYTRMGVVCYDNEQAAFILDDCDRMTMALLYSDEDLIIGNIYENPELVNTR